MNRARSVRPGAAAPGQMPFLDHVEELRWRIIWSVLSLMIGAIVGTLLVIKAEVVGLLLLPLNQALREGSASPAALGISPSGQLYYLSLTEHFFFILKVGVGTGLLLASPIIVYQAWAFLSPAFEPREKRIIIPSLYFGVVLFLAGVALAYFFALPASIRFLLSIGSEYFTPMLTAGYYLSFVMSILLAFGILFEMPAVLMILSGLGVVTPAFLRSRRRHAYAILTVISALVSPGDVVFVTLMLLAPLIILYEVSISLATVIYNRSVSSARQERVVDPLILWFVLGRLSRSRIHPQHGA